MVADVAGASASGGSCAATDTERAAIAEVTAGLASVPGVGEAEALPEDDDDIEAPTRKLKKGGGQKLGGALFSGT